MEEKITVWIDLREAGKISLDGDTVVVDVGSIDKLWISSARFKSPEVDRLQLRCEACGQLLPRKECKDGC